MSSWVQLEEDVASCFDICDYKCVTKPMQREL